MKTLRLGLMFWAAAALAQFPGQSPYPGGQNPGGQNPGGQNPGGRRNPQQQQQQQQGSRRGDRPVTSSTDGMVRRVSGNQLVIQTDDHRVVWFRITAQTAGDKNGAKTDVGSFAPGDHISVDATQDDAGNLTAATVSWSREGTPAERAAAQQTWDLPGKTSAADPSRTASRDASSNIEDDDRPILRRQNSDAATPDSPPAPPTPAVPQAPATPQAPPAPPSPQAANQPADNDAGPTPPATRIEPGPAPRDADDPGRPVLRRGGAATARQPDAAPVPSTPASPSSPPAPPAASSAPRSPATASAAPAILGTASATQSSSSTRPPAVLAQEDPLIPKVREAAFNFTSSLPNFFCQQLTTRYRSQNAKDWDTVDLIQADVAYADGQESYKNIKIDNRPTSKSMNEIGGSTSTGEFSTLLLDLMSESTSASFRRDVTDTIHGRSAIVFKVDVPRERSHWRVEAPSQLYYPAYRGSIWVDKATSRVLRIEIQARGMPAAFPFDTVESATDYDFIRLAAGESEFLLPANAEVLSCERGTSYCTRNRIEFRNYKKFDAASNISFK